MKKSSGLERDGGGNADCISVGFNTNQGGSEQLFSYHTRRCNDANYKGKAKLLIGALRSEHTWSLASGRERNTHVGRSSALP